MYRFFQACYKLTVTAMNELRFMTHVAETAWCLQSTPELHRQCLNFYPQICPEVVLKHLSQR